MIVRFPEPRHAAAWALLRHALWPADLPGRHRAEIDAQLAAAPGGAATFIALDDDDGSAPVIGFVEAALRHDYVNGCDTSPVAFVEGLFVAPAHRRRGVARALVAAVRDWARAAGVTELASDADLGNTASHALHAALGFIETERVVFFRQRLDA